MTRNKAKAKAQKNRGKRRVWNLIKCKFGNEEKELTVDEYDRPFTIFTQVDEDERYERHMKPIRKAQEKYEN